MANKIYRIGGFAAYNTGRISDCYSNMKLSASGVTGGFCGENKGVLKNCLSKGNIQLKKNEKQGGFCGRQNGRMKECLWVCNQEKLQGKDYWNDWENAVLKNDLEKQADTLFSNWDQENIWKIRNENKNKTDPQLLDVSMNMDARKNIVEISNKKELLQAAEDISNGSFNSDTVYRLKNNINMKDHLWEPICSDSNNPFSGCFDGNGHTIKNFRIQTKNNAYSGFFGCIGKKGEVHNLTLDGVIENQGEYVAALCGCNEGLISNCIVRTVCSASRYTGGFVSQNNGFIVRSCVLGEIKLPPKILWWWPLLALAVISCMIPAAFVVKSNVKDKETFAPVIMDPNAKPMDKKDFSKPVVPEKEPENMTDSGAAFIMNSEMTVSKDNLTGVIGLRCPPWSQRGFVATATVSAKDLKKNGSSYTKDAVIYKSGLIAPKYGVNVITLSDLPDGSKLPAGSYSINVQLDFYDIKTNECSAVNTSAPLDLIVR